MVERVKTGRLCEFPPVSPESWRERVEASLSGGSIDQLASQVPGGIDVRPLYVADDVDRAGAARGPERGTSPMPGAAAKSGWLLAQEYGADDPEGLARALGEDQGRGIECAWIRLHDGPMRGEATGPWSDRAQGLRVALASVDLGQVSVVLEAGLGAPELAQALAGLARERGLECGSLRGAVLCDPIGPSAAHGPPVVVDDAYAALGEATARIEREGMDMATALATGRPFHEAGASPVCELGLVIAAAIEHARFFERQGLELEGVARRLVLELSVGDDQFVEAARLRAARLLWAGVAGVLGLGDETPWIHARTSARGRSLDDPWADVLRATMRTFAAIVGGADSVATRAFDQGALARRMAVNTQLVLRDESHLGRVADPGGGSYYLEVLTESVARSAWHVVRALERRGGLRELVGAGATSSGIVAEFGSDAAASATEDR